MKTAYIVFEHFPMGFFQEKASIDKKQVDIKQLQELLRDYRLYLYQDPRFGLDPIFETQLIPALNIKLPGLTFSQSHLYSLRIGESVVVAQVINPGKKLKDFQFWFHQFTRTK